MNRLQMVVGLAFNSTRDTVALVLKTKGPECVIGNWNGVGGKIEPGEMANEAMAREFYEETGADIPKSEWLEFCVLNAPDYDLYFFYAVTDRVLAARTVEVEEIRLWPIASLGTIPNLMHNIRWMVPFLLDDQIAHHLGRLNVHR